MNDSLPINDSLNDPLQALVMDQQAVFMVFCLFVFYFATCLNTISTTAIMDSFYKYTLKLLLSEIFPVWMFTCIFLTQQMRARCISETPVREPPGTTLGSQRWTTAGSMGVRPIHG